MARYRGINHLAMVTKDMQQTIRFWRDLLGFKLVAGLGRPGYRHYFFRISDTDMIAFFEWEGVEPLPEKDHGVPVKGPVVFDHISFAVECDEDLWEIKEKLEAAGNWVSEVVDHGFIHSLYAFDPNGIPIEFSSPVPGVDLNSSPRMADLQPVQAAMEGPDPQAGHWPPATMPIPEEEKMVFPGEGEQFLYEQKNHWEVRR